MIVYAWDGFYQRRGRSREVAWRSGCWAGGTPIDVIFKQSQNPRRLSSLAPLPVETILYITNLYACRNNLGRENLLVLNADNEGISALYSGNGILIRLSLLNRCITRVFFLPLQHYAYEHACFAHAIDVSIALAKCRFHFHRLRLLVIPLTLIILDQKDLFSRYY